MQCTSAVKASGESEGLETGDQLRSCCRRTRLGVFVPHRLCTATAASKRRTIRNTCSLKAGQWLWSGRHHAVVWTLGDLLWTLGKARSSTRCRH
ncbi:hypothetical protein BDA96_07G214400 [Sorghum bicolor]|uniref:Uncharacterized protein n=2 Tax=Sorghum bicolor TaxID=4558 RepID=A0A921UBA9_SORBI|nr:hypothetical protein BDA96_07G214400 [Sorghum bicolor]OQU80871.1 hypothetical protein SORBI_3007G201650 [Sorghum bicolor]